MRGSAQLPLPGALLADEGSSPGSVRFRGPSMGLKENGSRGSYHLPGSSSSGYAGDGSSGVLLRPGRVSWDGQQQQQEGGGAAAGPPHHHPPPGSRAASAYSTAAQQQQHGGAGGGAGPRSDFVQSALNLTTCVLGAGALGYPFCFKECGLLLATIIMFATLLATRVSYQLLLYCAQLCGRRTYEGIAEAALGRPGRQVVELCITATNLGALVAFLDILADVLSSVAGTIIPPGAEPSRHAYITGVTLLGALPISLVVREPGLIASMSNAAVVFVVVFAVVVFCTAFGPSAAAALGVRWAALTGGHLSAAAAKAAHAPVLHMWNPSGVLVSLPVMAYGFTAHQYYMGIYGMLKAPSIRRMKAVTDAALLACAAVYWTVGVGGYATFGDRTSGDIIRNFGGARAAGIWGAYERALKLCYGMAVLGNIPLVIMPFSSILAPLLPGDEALKARGSRVAAACSVHGAARATAAALSGCRGGGGGLGLGLGGGGACSDVGAVAGGSCYTGKATGAKARTSGSGGGGGGGAPGGRHGFSEGGSGAAQGVCVDAESLQVRLQAPTWHQRLQTQQEQSLLAPHSKQQQQRDEDGAPPDDEPLPQHPHLPREAARTAHLLTGPQHTLVVVLVLGVGLASALWLPNVELIFGLTGSTASVLAAFIMPAVCFLRLYEMAPELGSGGGRRYHPLGGGGSSAWRLARQLLCCCCDCCGLGASWLLGPSGPAAYARLASRPGGRQHRSSDPSSWQGSPRVGGAASSSGGASSAHKVWGPVLVVPELRAQWACRQRLALLLLVFGLISGLLCTDAMLGSIRVEKAVVQLAQELVAHEAVAAEATRAQQKAKEAAAAVDAVSTAAQQLGAVDTATNQTLGSLAAAAAALNTIAGPSSRDGAGGGGHHAGASERQQQPSVWDLKGRIEQHKQKAVEDSVLRNVEAALSAAAADLAATTSSVTAVIIKLDSSIAQIKADAAAAAAAAATAPVMPPAHGAAATSSSSDTAAAKAGTASSSGGGGEGAQDAAAGAQHAPAAAAGEGGGTAAFQRANEMARELGKALGTFGRGDVAANLTLTAGRSLEQVRDSAVSALTALNVTADVVRQVRGAVSAARRSHHDGAAKEMAVAAMQRALNATAASALATRITREALSTAASEETSELLTALTRVARDLERSAGMPPSSSSSSSSGGSGSSKRAGSITVTSEGGVGDAAGAGQAAAGTARGASDGTHSAAASGGAQAGHAAAADGSSRDGAAAAARGRAGDVPADGTSSGSGGAAAAHQPQQQQQPGHPTREQHEAAAAAAANEAAHAEAAESPGGGSTSAGNPAQHGAPGATAAASEAGLPSAAHLLPSSADNAAAGKGQQAAADAGSSSSSAAAGHEKQHAPQETASDSDSSSSSRDAGEQQQLHTHAVPPPDDTPAAQPDDSKAPGSSSSGSGDDSGSSIDAGDAPGHVTSTHSGGRPGGAAPADTSAVDKALSAAEAAKVRAVIAQLASVLSSGANPTSSSSTGSRSGSGTAAAGHAAAAANITQLSAAIRDAVAWTQQSKAAALSMIAQDLHQTDPKVAQRVLGIVEEVSTSERDSGSGHKAQAEAQEAKEAAVDVAAARNHAAAAAATAAAAAAAARERGEARHESGAVPAAVAGPVVAVAADGHLQQPPTVVGGAQEAHPLLLSAGAAAAGHAQDADANAPADAAAGAHAAHDAADDAPAAARRRPHGAAAAGDGGGAAESGASATSAEEHPPSSDDVDSSSGSRQQEADAAAAEEQAEEHGGVASTAAALLRRLSRLLL